MGSLLANSSKIDEDFVPGMSGLDAEPAEMPENGKKRGINKQQGESGSSSRRDQGGEEEEGKQDEEQGEDDDPDENDGKTESETTPAVPANLETYEEREHGISLSSA
jgi:hypothetical protein